MKIKIFLMTFCIMLISFMGIESAEAASFTTVRVGLANKYREVQSIAISEKNIVLGYNNYGEFAPIIQISASTGFAVTIPAGYYAKTPGNFSSYAEAKMHGTGTVLFTGNEYILLKGPFVSQAEAQNSGDLFAPSSNSVVLNADGVPAVIFDSTAFFMQISPAAGADSISLGDRRYRDEIEFGRYTGKNITAVNVLPIDHYMYSVVPSEMPSSWNIEALKAQAVAVRSYTVNRAGVHASEGYEVCDGIHCQSYLGKGNESQRTTEAVNATSGQFAYYGDKPISATYFSSSGGVTDNSENVWPNAEPYLRGDIEIAEREYKQWQRTFTLTDLTKLANSGGQNIGTVQSITLVHQANSRVGQLILNGTNGKRTLQKEEIRTFFSGTSEGSLLSRNFYISGTNPPQIIPGGVLPSGGDTISVRPSGGPGISASSGGVYIVDENGKVTASNSNELVVLGRDSVFIYGGQSGASGQTPDLPVTTTQSTGNSITLIGKGNGHGVGMSQYGAKGMAESGYTYKQIIEFYYTGAVVR